MTQKWENDNMSYISNLSTELPTMGHMLREAGYEGGERLRVF